MAASNVHQSGSDHDDKHFSREFEVEHPDDTELEGVALRSRDDSSDSGTSDYQAERGSGTWEQSDGAIAYCWPCVPNVFFRPLEDQVCIRTGRKGPCLRLLQLVPAVIMSLVLWFIVYDDIKQHISNKSALNGAVDATCTILSPNFKPEPPKMGVSCDVFSHTFCHFNAMTVMYEGSEKASKYKGLSGFKVGMPCSSPGTCTHTKSYNCKPAKLGTTCRDVLHKYPVDVPFACSVLDAGMIVDGQRATADGMVLAGAVTVNNGNLAYEVFIGIGWFTFPCILFGLWYIVIHLQALLLPQSGAVPSRVQGASEV